MKPRDELPYLEWTEPDSGEVKRLYADVILSESANLPAVVSQHAVETGAKITDHYRKDNESVRVSYFFSGAPLRGDLDQDNPGERGPVALTYEANAASPRPGTTGLKYEAGPGPGLALLNPFNALSAGVDALAAAVGIGGLPKNVTPSELERGAPLPKRVEALTFAAAPNTLQRAIETVRRLQTQGILVTAKTTLGRFEDCGIIDANPKRNPEDGTSGTIDFELQQLRFATSDIALALPVPVEPRAIPKKTASATGGNGLGAGGAQESAARKGLREFGGIQINP